MAKKKVSGSAGVAGKAVPAKSLPPDNARKGRKASPVKISLQIDPPPDPGCSTKSHTLLIATLLSTAQLTLRSNKDVVIEPAGKNGKTNVYRLTFK